MAVSKRQIEERKMRQGRILTGALEVFKSRGIENSTMEEIAEKSGFGKATLYYYFQSKEEVFAAILENGWLMLWSNLEPVIAESSSPTTGKTAFCASRGVLSVHVQKSMPRCPADSEILKTALIEGAKLG